MHEFVLPLFLMNKKFSKGMGVILLLFFILLHPLFVLAQGDATIELRVPDNTLGVNQTVDVDIFIDPFGENLDTVRVDLSFPSETLQVEHFQRGELYPYASPGGNTDNAHGVFSEGGFTLQGPVKEKGRFGTVTFRAVSAGQAEISVLETSKLISNGEEKINPSLVPTLTLSVIEGVKSDDGMLLVESPTHPQSSKWSRETIAKFSWEASEGSNVTRYFIDFDQSSNTDPSEPLSDTTLTQREIADGIWYFHVKAELADGSTSVPVHYRIQVDTVAPQVFEPVLEDSQFSEGDTVTISFATMDDTSGIDHYEVALNDTPFAPVDPPLILKDVPEGTHIVRVKAVDRAGNETFGQQVFRVYPSGEYEAGIPPAETAPVPGIAPTYLTGIGLWIIVFVLILVGAIILLTLRKRK